MSRRATSLARRAAVLGLLAALGPGLAAAPAPAAAGGYSATRGGSRAVARFVVTYIGSGTYHTTYHGTPPSDPARPNGPHDTNDASDSSTQSWALRFRSLLTVPTCGARGHHHVDPCRTLSGLFDATGSSGFSGVIHHSHVDGLFPADNATANCQTQSQTPARRTLRESLQMRYSSHRRAVTITTHNPIADALSLLPAGCNGQTDSIDGLYDNYFTPGFSFARGYGPERWFVSRPIVIPLGVFHRSSMIRVPVTLTANGRPPADCAVLDSSREQCSTGGAWSGVLTFRAKR